MPRSLLFLKKPSNIRSKVEYDPETGDYNFIEKIGNLDYRLPKSMSKKEFQLDAATAKPLYEQLAAQLHAKIRKGEYPEGKPLPPINALEA